MTKIQEKRTNNQNLGWTEAVRNDSRGDMIVAGIQPGHRIESLDLLRGVVMIIMVLDHVRMFFHFDSFLFSPVDLSQTSAGLFITRWVTHLCAPTFIFLAGVSTYFIAQKKTIKDTSYFLLTRGIWLVFLQLTIIRFAWNFDPLFHYNSNTIISAIGFCMIALSGFIFFRMKTIFIIGITMVVGHNLLDGVAFEYGTTADILWSFLHVNKSYQLGNGYAFGLLYPLFPWVGVMALGYCFGIFFSSDYTLKMRKTAFQQLGLICLLIFLTLRFSNIYGDPVPWNRESDFSVTLMSFFNVEKYPPSLLFLSITLGISLLLLAGMEGKSLKRWKFITLFGNVALFYFVAHIFLIHILAVIAAVATGYPLQSMVFLGPVTKGTPWLNGSYGFSLWVVYSVWFMVVVLLYPLCVYWNSFKIQNKKKWWVSYV